MYFKRCEVTSNVEYFKDPDIQATIKKYDTIKRWAYILHDKDDTAPHYHIFLDFGRGSVSDEVIGGWFGLQPSQVNRIHDLQHFFKYLVHGNSDDRNKHQYSWSEVTASFDIENEVRSADIVGDFEHFSYAQMLRHVNSLPVDEKVKESRKLDSLWKLQCKCMTLDTDRNIDVVFICGRGGVGKTFYAKKLLSSMDYDFCLSSSSNDPFQDYLGQRAIVLDDLRDSTFQNFEDLLKILDNNNSSSVQSRYCNKVFNGKMIVITSAVPLRYWYRTNCSLKAEDFNQLYRRIGCYVEVEKDVIRVFTSIDSNGSPSGEYECFRNDLFSDSSPVKKGKTDFVGMFDKFCTRSEDSLPF